MLEIKRLLRAISGPANIIVQVQVPTRDILDICYVVKDFFTPNMENFTPKPKNNGL